MKRLIELRKKLKQKYKGGFTLIELLAVIVILAIILIITIPNVLTSVNNAKKKSFASVSAIFKKSIKDYMEYASLGIGNGNNPALVELCGNDGSDCKGKAKYFTVDIIQSFGYSTDDIDKDGSYFTIDNKNNVLVCLKPKQSGKFANIGNSGECNNLLTDAIFTKAKCKDNCPTVTESNIKNVTSSTGEVGLYQSSDTLNDNPTYYYRGAVDNNYVSFGTHATDIWYGYKGTTSTYPGAIYPSEGACNNASNYNIDCTRKAKAGDPIIWRIIRINEDGTIRLISELAIMIKPINTLYNDFSNMYYSNGNSEGKAYYELDRSPTSWYKNNLSGYEAKIATSTYCEAARVRFDDSYTAGAATMILYSSYTPTFKCAIDGNNKGQVNSKVGLITYDEVVYAGGNSNYINNDTCFWTMSPAGFISNNARAYAWSVFPSGNMNRNFVDYTLGALRPVISLTSDTLVIGEGTIGDPYIVQ